MSKLRFWGLMIFLLGVPLYHANSDSVSPTRNYHIDELVQKAIESSQELKLLDEDIQRSNMELQNAKTSYLPRISLQGNVGIDLLSVSSFDPDNNLGANLILDWNFFQNGLVFFRIEQARAQVELSQLQKKRQIIEIGYRVKIIVYDILLKKAMMDLLSQDLRLTEKFLEKTRTEFEQGIHRRAELLKVETQVFEKQNQLEKVRREYHLLVQKLQIEASLPPEDEIEFGTGGLDDVSLESKNTCFDIALKNRAEVRESEIQFELSRKAIRLAKLGRWPRVDLFAGNAFAVDDFESSSDQFQFRTGVIARYPLYDGGETKVQIILAEMASRKSEFQWNQSKQRVIEDVENAFEEVLNAQEFMQSGEAQLKAIRDESKKAEIEYENGNLSAFEWDEAQFNFKKAKIHFLDIEVGVLKSKAHLAKVLGFVNLEEAFSKNKEVVSK